MIRRLLFLLVLLQSANSLIAENFMTLTTSKAVGSKINLSMYCDDDSFPVWIDWNNNGIQDSDEASIPKGSISYIIKSQNFKIYGPVSRFTCSNCGIVDLDVSTNSKLTELYCSYNGLLKLNLANSHNSEMTCMQAAYGNEQLTCIQIDPEFDSTKVNYWSKPVDANYSITPCTKIVKEQSKIVFATEKGSGSKLSLKMLSGTSSSNPDIWIDLNDNGTRDENENVVLRQNHEYLLAAETITVYGDVTEFEYLGCEFNHCRDNFLTSLDVSHNKLLTKIVVPFNHLSTLDVSQQEKLTFLNVSNNNLTSLNVMDCNLLETLHCYSNQLTTLDLSTNTALSFVQCNNTNLDQLDVSHNPLLKELHCYFNPSLTQLDVSHNPLLEILYVAGCQLTDLDVSSNPNLKKINCSSNALTQLNLANGFNSKIWQSTAENNPNLICIQIDSNFTPNNTWTKDATANYSSSDCSTYVPEYEVQVEDSKWFHFKTNFDVKRHKKDEAVNDYKDIMKVEAEKSVEENLNFKLQDFPERLFEVVVVDKDNEHQDHFMKLTTLDDATKAFKMPRHKVRLTTKVVVKKNQTEAIPNQAYYLEFHEGASLTNKPVSGKTQVDDLVMYKRTFKPTNWYAISFPFEVSRVTVKDQDVEYDIYNCYSAKDPNGHFYLKYIEDKVEQNAVKSSWKFEEHIQKNKSYIIAFPNAYFKDKEITFYGFGQDINDESNQFTEHPNQGGRHYNYRCNTSYNDQIIQDPYLLNAEGTYFIKHDGPYTLKPFMSYIYSISTDSSAPRYLSMKDVLEPQKEPTAIDSSKENTLDYHIEGKHLVLKSSMNQGVKITKVNGQLVGHYTLTSNSEEIITLETGVYILNSSNNQAIKISIL